MGDTKKPAATYTADYIKGDWQKAVYLDNPHVDNLMTAFLGLGAEHWALRRRVKVLEKFMADKKIADPSAIESYVPTEAETVAWDAERDEFISRVFSVFSRETMGQASDTMPTKRSPPLDKF